MRSALSSTCASREHGGCAEACQCLPRSRAHGLRATTVCKLVVTTELEMTDPSRVKAPPATRRPTGRPPGTERNAPPAARGDGRQALASYVTQGVQTWSSFLVPRAGTPYSKRTHTGSTQARLPSGGPGLPASRVLRKGPDGGISMADGSATRCRRASRLGFPVPYSGLRLLGSLSQACCWSRGKLRPFQMAKIAG
jgi:hypothetical protein